MSENETVPSEEQHDENPDLLVGEEVEPEHDLDITSFEEDDEGDLAIEGDAE